MIKSKCPCWICQSFWETVMLSVIVLVLLWAFASGCWIFKLKEYIKKQNSSMENLQSEYKEVLEGRQYLIGTNRSIHRAACLLKEGRRFEAIQEIEKYSKNACGGYEYSNLEGWYNIGG